MNCGEWEGGRAEAPTIVHRSRYGLGSYRWLVDEREADEWYTRLVANVTAARELLTQFGEDHWASWMAAVHGDLTARDAHGLKRLIGAYGGMGSFNDVVIHPVNGHSVAEDDIDRANRSLAGLRTVMYTDAKALLHDLERAP